MRDYIVTVIAKYPAVGTNARDDMEITAPNAAKAISYARDIMRNAGWSRHDGPLSYTVKANRHDA